MIILPILTTSLLHFSLTLSLPRVINVKFPLQPHQKYNITKYGELGFSLVTQIIDDYSTNSHYFTNKFLFRRLGECSTFFNVGVKGLKGWENVQFGLKLFGFTCEHCSEIRTACSQHHSVRGDVAVPDMEYHITQVLSLPQEAQRAYQVLAVCYVSKSVHLTAGTVAMATVRWDGLCWTWLWWCHSWAPLKKKEKLERFRCYRHARAGK